MKKSLFSVLFVFCLINSAFASGMGPLVTNILATDDTVNIDVSGTSTQYTEVFRLKGGEYFGLAYQAVSASGTPTVKIELEQSWTDSATAGAADDNYVEPESFSDIETTLTTETWHIKSISPVSFPYARLKITGNSGNPSDTVVQAKLGKQEK